MERHLCSWIKKQSVKIAMLPKLISDSMKSLQKKPQLVSL